MSIQLKISGKVHKLLALIRNKQLPKQIIANLS
jgi:hypothetical protein